MKKVFLLLLIIFVFSCNNTAKEKEIITQTNKQEKVEQLKELNVIIKFQTNKADTFKLILNNVIVNEAQKKNIQIIEKIIPTTSDDEINALFGANNISKKFQIFFGNKEEKEIDIKSIEMSYGSNTVNITPSEINKYFSFNKFIDQDPTTFKLQTKKINGKHAPKISMKSKVYAMLTKE